MSLNFVTFFMGTKYFRTFQAHITSFHEHLLGNMWTYNIISSHNVTLLVKCHKLAIVLVTLYMTSIIVLT